MKVIISIITALALFIGLSLWNQKVLEDTSHELSRHAEEIRIAVIENDWEKAQEATELQKKTWTRYKKLWLVLVDHDEIDDIDSCIFKIDEMVKNRDKTESLLEIAELRFHVHDASDKESLSFANIF